MDWLSRTNLLVGEENINKLKKARVAVFGIGGVGGYSVEALARSGIGAFDLFDNDTICESNINRQIIATTKTVGQYKVDAAKARVLEINPEAAVNANILFFLPENAHEIDFTQFDYIIDAIDTMAGKIKLVLKAREAGVPIISAMAAGNKMNPAAFEVADIYKTEICPVARVMRRELRRHGVEKLKVVYSKEPPVTPLEIISSEGRRQIPGSTAFVPAASGLIIAAEAVRDLINGDINPRKTKK
jgi:tRNA A37 threonylcarbamoyladenosine dehydratase